MDNNKLIGLGLIGVAVYYAWSKGYLAQWFPSVTGAGTSTTPQANTNTSSTADNSQTLALIAAAAKADSIDLNSYQTADVWNYYYAKVRNVPGPDPSTMGITNYQPGMKISISDWWAAMNKSGFSGLGLIARTDPYSNPMGRLRFNTRGGSLVTPLGSEVWAKRIN